MTEAGGRPRLTLAVGDARFRIEDGRSYAVGRGASCELRINHASVAERHCLLSCADGQVTVEDLGSHTGTHVDGQPVQRQRIAPGQCLRVGDIELRLSAGGGGPTAAPRRPIADPRLRFREQGFADLMADELRRAPWFTLSAAIHALLLLLLFHLLDAPVTTGERSLALELRSRAEEPALQDAEAPPELEIREEREVLQDLVVEDPFEQVAELDAAEPSVDVDFGDTGLLASTNWLQNVKGKEGGLLGHAAVRAGGFGKTVSSIRRSGLEIVFVFDSTGSMGSILQGTKERIANMLELLHGLVPDARVGLITYRDRDPSEEYLTREIPLGPDIYRAINFMQVIEAGGGGNRPEAVLDGLAAAFQQAWHPKARRVVVLIGDAPAHAFDHRKIKGLVKGFAGNGRSFVHSIVTAPSGSDDLPEDTKRSFAEIATAGRGECLGFENETLVLQQVLSLAFGSEFRSNLDEAARILEGQRSKVATFALDLVQREDLAELEQRLRDDPVSDEVVKALARSTSKRIAHFLVDMLARRDLGQPGRQAAAHALGHVMGGRLRDALGRFLAQASEGAGPKRRAWELGPLLPQEASRLRKLIG